MSISSLINSSAIGFNNKRKEKLKNHSSVNDRTNSTEKSKIDNIILQNTIAEDYNMAQSDLIVDRKHLMYNNQEKIGNYIDDFSYNNTQDANGKCMTKFISGNITENNTIDSHKRNQSNIIQIKKIDSNSKYHRQNSPVRLFNNDIKEEFTDQDFNSTPCENEFGKNKTVINNFMVNSSQKKKSHINNKMSITKCKTDSNAEFVDTERFHEIIKNSDNFFDQLTESTTNVLSQAHEFNNEMSLISFLADTTTENSDFFKSSFEKCSFDKMKIISNDVISIKNILETNLDKQRKFLSSLNEFLQSKFNSPKSGDGSNCIQEYENLHKSLTTELNKEVKSFGDNFYLHKNKNKLLDSLEKQCGYESPTKNRYHLKKDVLERLKSTNINALRFPAVKNDTMLKTAINNKVRKIVNAATRSPNKNNSMSESLCNMQQIEWNSYYPKKSESMSKLLYSPKDNKKLHHRVIKFGSPNYKVELVKIKDGNKITFNKLLKETLPAPSYELSRSKTTKQL